MQSSPHSNLDKLVYLWLSYQNISMFNIATVEGRRATVEIGVNIFMDIQRLIMPDLSMEVGAREASYSRQMRHLFPKLSIVAVEGSPEAHSYYAKQHDFSSQNIDYLQCVVSDHSGVVDFNIVKDRVPNDTVPGTNGRNSLNHRDYSKSKFDYDTIQVQSLTGDELLNRYNAYNAALWIDVEGSAKQVLLSLEKSLQQQRIAAIYIELESKEIWHDQWSCYDTMSYLLMYNFIPIYKDTEVEVQGNFIFIRNDLIDGYLTDIISKNIYNNDLIHLKIKELDEKLEQVNNSICELQSNYVAVLKVVKSLFAQQK